MRVFPFRSQGRLLRVVVVPAQEVWQLWVCEEDQRLAYGGRVSVDEAMRTILSALDLVRGRTALTAALPARGRVDVASWDQAWLREVSKV